MTEFVLDASVCLAWAFEDEQFAAADSGFGMMRAGGAHAPGVWPYEVRNGLLAGERRGRITPEDASAFLHHLSRIPVALDQTMDDASLFRLARAHRLSAYDAAYLELAMRLKLPLATLDERLAAAAAASGVPQQRHRA